MGGIQTAEATVPGMVVIEVRMAMVGPAVTGIRAGMATVVPDTRITLIQGIPDRPIITVRVPVSALASVAAVTMAVVTTVVFTTACPSGTAAV